MFSEHIAMSTQASLDKAVDEMGLIFKKYPGLRQLLKDMHGYIVAPSPEAAYFMKLRIENVRVERLLGDIDAGKLRQFVQLYLYVFDHFTPDTQRLMLDKLARHGAEQTLNRFTLKKPQ